MTAIEFAEDHSRQPRTVRSWIQKGLIPGAHDDYVPGSAREPDTMARARKGYPLLKRILKACAEGKGVSAEIYQISPEQFQACIDSLIRDGLVIAHEEDGITYYDATISGHEKLTVLKPADWIALAAAFASWFPVLMQLFG